MKPTATRRAALALLLSAISISSLAGCASTDRRLAAAGTALGAARAGVALPAWPGHCAAAVGHAAARIGDDAVSVLRRERAQLDFANQRAANCGAWYGALRAEHAGK